MKRLVLLMSCVFAVEMQGRGLGSQEAGQELAKHIITVATKALIVPSITAHGKLLTHSEYLLVRRHGEAARSAAQNALAARPDLLGKFVEFLNDPQLEIDDLSAELYDEMARAASQYVATQEDLPDSRFSWIWGKEGGYVANLNDASRKNILARALEGAVQRQHKLRAREGAVFPLEENIRSLFQGRLDAFDPQDIDFWLHDVGSLPNFSEEIPEVKILLTHDEVVAVKKMATNPEMTLAEIVLELDLMLQKSLGKKDNDIKLQQRVHFVDVISRAALTEMIKTYYGRDYVNSEVMIPHLINMNLADPRNSFVLNALSDKLEWDLTWAQLRENRTLSEATDKFLSEMNLDWHTLGQIVYPDSKLAAAKFITSLRFFSDHTEEKTFIAALKRYRETIQNEDQRALVDAYIAEIPHLVEKTRFLLTMTKFNDDANKDERAYAGLEGSSPSAIVGDALAYFSGASEHWGFLDVGYIRLLGDHPNLYTPSLTLAVTVQAMLVALGYKQPSSTFLLSDIDYSPYYQAHSRAELESLRKTLISDEDITYFLAHVNKIKTEAGDSIPEDLRLISRLITSLQLTMQLERFVQYFSANPHFYKSLESDSVFLDELKALKESEDKLDRNLSPLATVLVEFYYKSKELQKNQSSNRRKKPVSEFRKLRNTLAKIAKDMRTAERKYRATVAELQGNDTKTAPPLPKKYDHSLQQQNQKIKKEKEQREQIATQVTKLVNKMGKKPMPNTTPIWLRLRALLAYMEADSRELAQRAEMRDIVDAERFAMLISSESSHLPTITELNSIEKALAKHTTRRAERKLIIDSTKSRLLENMKKEIAIIRKLISG